jgi:hypothetical protein
MIKNNNKLTEPDITINRTSQSVAIRKEHVCQQNYNFRGQKYDEEGSRKYFKIRRSYNGNTAFVECKNRCDKLIIEAIGSVS